MATGLVHKVRNGGRGGEATYTLTDLALTWQGDEASGSVPFTDITQLRLITSVADITDPSVIHGQMTLKTKSGQRLKERSHHYLHLGSYENRVETYGPFVRGLCQRVAEANPAARFTTGTPILRIFYLAMAVCCAAFGALFGLAILFGEANREMILGCALSVSVAGGCWALFKRSKTHEFDGTDPPAHLLAF